MYFWKGSFILNSMNIISYYISKLMDFCFIILWIILLFVMNLLINIFMNKFNSKKYKEMPNLEFLWTIFPSFILLLIAIPSIFTLYLMESKKKQNLSVKITGHQWYWNYNYFNKFEFDSYMESSNLSNYRILETDNHFILPLGENFIIITSEDVLHSWSMPSLMLKMDANPGRLNSIFFKNMLPGIFYGQCSEICGANHTFMPITLEFVNFLNFKNWSMIKMFNN